MKVLTILLILLMTSSLSFGQANIVSFSCPDSLSLDSQKYLAVELKVNSAMRIEMVRCTLWHFPSWQADLIVLENQAGIWRGETEFNRFACSGFWQISLELICDNALSIYFSTNDLARLGLPNQLHVFNPQADCIPPSLVSFTALPDTTDQQKNGVIIHAHLTDQGSPIKVVKVNYCLPSGEEQYRVWLELTSGTTLDGEWTGDIDLNANPQAKLCFPTLTAIDRAGNYLLLNQEEMQQKYQTRVPSCARKPLGQY